MGHHEYVEISRKEFSLQHNARLNTGVRYYNTVVTHNDYSCTLKDYVVPLP